jgi:hypothetical protein
MSGLLVARIAQDHTVLIEGVQVAVGSFVFGHLPYSCRVRPIFADALQPTSYPVPDRCVHEDWTHPITQFAFLFHSPRRRRRDTAAGQFGALARELLRDDSHRRPRFCQHRIGINSSGGLAPKMWRRESRLCEFSYSCLTTFLLGVKLNRAWFFASR